jgi:8-oxo-dGTP pyrophosphatase MutT (NUDIX family)
MVKRREPPPMASAVIHRTRQGTREVLIGKIPTEPYEGRWCFPSGPIEEGEAPEAALRRVVQNLIGISVRVVWGQPPFDQEWDDVTCRWRFFFCETTDSRVHNDYFAQIRWVPEGALREYDFDPVTQRVVDWMLETPTD